MTGSSVPSSAADVAPVMQLYQAKRVKPKFGDDWSIQACVLLGLETEIKALQLEIVGKFGDWDDLPHRGRIYSDSTREQLEEHLDELKEMAALA